jgi:hypothetical protein
MLDFNAAVVTKIGQTIAVGSPFNQIQWTVVVVVVVVVVGSGVDDESVSEHYRQRR